MTSPANPRVIIVGAGILGCMLAYDFSRRNATVMMIDKQQPARGATSGSFAWITNQTKFRNADGLAEEEARHYFNLHRLSHARWRLLQTTIGKPLPIRWRGTLQLAEPGTEEAVELLAELDRRQRWGSPSHLVVASEAKDIEPALDPGRENLIMYTPDEGLLDPVAITGILLDEALHQGATFSPDDDYLSLDKDNDGYTLRSRQATRTADIVVFAGGIDNPGIGQTLGLSVPLTSSVGSIVHLMPRAPLFDTVLLSGHCHALQRMDGRVLVAKHFSGSPVGDLSAPDPGTLIESVARILPGLSESVVEKVTETRRIIPADGLPILSRNADLPGVVALTANAAVSLAPILSQLVVTELLDQVEVEVLNRYRSDRFRSGREAPFS